MSMPDGSFALRPATVAPLIILLVVIVVAALLPTVNPDVPTGPVGTWSSRSCGARAYERVINIAESGTFIARDLVAPCPEDVQCIQSRIDVAQGTWTRVSGGISLVARASPLALPPTMALGPDGLTEGSCVYRFVE